MTYVYYFADYPYRVHIQICSALFLICLICHLIIRRTEKFKTFRKICTIGLFLAGFGLIEFVNFQTDINKEAREAMNTVYKIVTESDRPTDIDEADRSTDYLYDGESHEKLGKYRVYKNLGQVIVTTDAPLEKGSVFFDTREEVYESNFSNNMKISIKKIFLIR